MSPRLGAAALAKAAADRAAAATSTPPVEPLWDLKFDWSEADIQPRRWIAPAYLLRGAVTLVVGPGASGKSLLMCGWTVGLALGRALNRMVPASPCRTLIFNVEDDAGEQQRRFSAALRPVGGIPANLREHVAVTGAQAIGTLLTRDAATGLLTFTPAMKALEARLAAFRPDVVILDPLVELHDVDENDNVEMRTIIASFRTLARNYDCAVVLVHHTRKGAAKGAGDPDIGRGASAVTAAARVVLTVTPMTEDEGRTLGLRPTEYRWHFRVDGAKQNYSRPTDAEWFVNESITLDNGESVPVAVPWSPPVDVVSDEVRAEIVHAIGQGTLHGPWGPKLDGNPRSVKGLFAQHGINTAAGQAKLLAELQAAGVTTATFKRPDNRMAAFGLRTAAGLPAATWVSAKDKNTK